MRTPSFSLLPPLRTFIGIFANLFLILYLLHVLHRLIKSVRFLDFKRWNELKRYHIVAVVLGISALISDIIVMAGCSALNDSGEEAPIECKLLTIGVAVPLLFASMLVIMESVLFSYCRFVILIDSLGST
jgi:hypothetical protein